jgi:dephospho-CoA kinase
MFIVGVTGGIATGKSTLCAVFRENGIPVIDADAAARKGERIGVEYQQLH